jgi:hypothetical protein
VSDFVTDKPPVLRRRRGRSLSLLYRADGLGLPAGQRLLGAGALHQRQLRSLVDLIKVLGVTLRLKVDVCLVVRDRGRLDRIVANLFRQLLESVVGLLAHQVTLFQPSFHSGGCAHPGEAPVATEDLYGFPVFYCPSFVVNRSHLVAQESLGSGDIGNLLRTVPPSLTARKQSYRPYKQKKKAFE